MTSAMKPQVDRYYVNYGTKEPGIGRANSGQLWDSKASLLSIFKRSRSTKRLIFLIGGLCIALALVIGLSVGLSLRAKTLRQSEKMSIRETESSDWSGVMVSSADFSQGAVSSDSQVCSEIGNYFLRKNGSAVDAAVATTLCAGLYAPQSTGIGGGFFMIIYDRKLQKSSVIDAREAAPKAASQRMFSNHPSDSKQGPLSVGVPGELHGLWTAHRMYGFIPWAELLQPIIELCYQGTAVTSSLARALREKRLVILKDPGLRETFFHPNSDRVLEEGDIVKRPKLAQTFEIISENGVDAFYNGQIGQNLIDELQKMGGIITMDDLRSYNSKLREPIVTNLSNNLRLHGLPPPASGPIMSNIMLTLDGYNFNNSEFKKDPILFNHRIIEAFKFAFAYRAEMGDPDFINMTQLVHELNSPEVAASIRQRIWNNRTFPAEHYEANGKFVIQDHGTSHLSVLAPNGDAVSLTSTVNLYFGSGILSPSTGIILNDEMDDFSSPDQINYFGVVPSSSNFITPGKRPVSSIVASIFTNSSTGDVRLVTGAAGGTRITTATVYAAIKHLWTDESLEESVMDFRLHHQLHPARIEYEAGFPKEILDGLEKLGHNISQAVLFGVVNSISNFEGKVEAVADLRKKGGVSGV